MKYVFGLLLILSVLVRMYRIQNPVADWHSFRQADTASVTREFVKHGIDLLHPTYHDLSNIQSGKDNPKGYRMVELPLLNGLTASIINTLNLQRSEVLVGRLISVFFSLVTLFSIYVLGKKMSGEIVGFIGAFLFAFMPYSIYYSRVILPEPAFLAFLTVSMVLYLLSLEKKNLVAYVLSFVSFALSLLIKPYGLFLIPVFFAMTYIKKGMRGLKSPKLLAFVLTLVPLYLWRKWILQFPEGIPASNWLYNKDNIRFSGAFIHWIFEVRIATLILGIGLIVPFVLGLLKKGKDWLFYTVWGVSLLVYLWIFAGGNVQHDYYQVVLLPFLFLTVGRGVQLLIDVSSQFIHRRAVIFSMFMVFIFSVFVSWYTIRGYFNVNRWEIVHAGEAADAKLPKNAKVIAPYMGDTAFLFQTNRTGWPIGFDIEDKIGKGAQYYITVNYDDEANALMKTYTTLEKTKEYLILDLTKPTTTK